MFDLADAVPDALTLAAVLLGYTTVAGIAWYRNLMNFSAYS